MVFQDRRCIRRGTPVSMARLISGHGIACIFIGLKESSAKCLVTTVGLCLTGITFHRRSDLCLFRFAIPAANFIWLIAVRDGMREQLLISRRMSTQLPETALWIIFPARPAWKAILMTMFTWIWAEPWEIPAQLPRIRFFMCITPTLTGCGTSGWHRAADAPIRFPRHHGKTRPTRFLMKTAMP